MSTYDIVETKNTFRKQRFADRKAMGSKARAEASLGIQQNLINWFESYHRPLHTVSATLKFGTEPDTDPALAYLVEKGVTVYVPVTGDAGALSWVTWEPNIATEKSAHGGMNEPVGKPVESVNLPVLDVIIVPAMAVDTAGFRMGKGGGFYDRFLAGIFANPQQSPALITPLFDAEFIRDGEVPHEEHDMPVETVITNAGIFAVGE